MQSQTTPIADAIGLTDLTFRAKIDFVTVFTPGKCDLPPLQGTVKWAKSANYRKLSIHDPTPMDVQALVGALANPDIAELEVAVDLAPPRALNLEERNRVLEQLHRVVARQLHPLVRHPELQSTFRGAYQPGRRLPYPFNKRLPSPSAQLLYGHRTDFLQVKVYPKRRDQNAALASEKHVLRIEVSLRRRGLAVHKLHTVDDLFGFDYRKQLSPYFRFISDVERRRSGRRESSPMLEVLHTKREEQMKSAWLAAGAGAFLPGGTQAGENVKFMRRTEINNRVGQALLRLTRRMKFVCGADNAALK